MNHRRMLSLLPAAIFALATVSCASASTSGAASGAPSGLSLATTQWSGNFQATQQASGDLEAPRGRNNVSGKVLLVGSGRDALSAQIDVSDVPTSMTDAHWALVTGRCGSGAIPVLIVSQFPTMTVSNGRAHLTGDVPIALPTSGTYHVNVYRSNGADESDVLACANLKMEPREM